MANRFRSVTALGLLALVTLAGGCTVENRMDRASDRDEVRRSEFEHCRAEGRTDCDAILNRPVDSHGERAERGERVRDQESREAYDRCIARGGTDCDDLLHPR